MGFVYSIVKDGCGGGVVDWIGVEWRLCECRVSVYYYVIKVWGGCDVGKS